MVELRVGNTFTDIIGPLPNSSWKEIERRLSFRPQGFAFSPLYNRWITRNGKKVRRIWDGWKRQAWKNTKRTYFPTGLYSLVAGCLKEHNVPFNTADCRTKPEKNIDLTLSEDFVERPYQTNVCDAAAKQQRGIIHAATGAGKTAISAGLIQRLSVSPFLFFVTSIDLLYQAKSELQKFLRVNGVPAKVGQVGAGVVEFGDITVLTIQTAVRALGKQWDAKTKFDSDDTDDATPIRQHAEDIRELLRTAKGCICDEVQHWRADTCQAVTRALESCYYIYGMSATPYRDEGDDLMIQACFGKKVAEITASELIKTIDDTTGKSYLMRPNIKMVHVRGVKSQFKQWVSIYKEQVVEDPYYNGAIANIANTYIDAGRLVLVLVQQINHGKYLESLIPDGMFISGQSPKQKRLNSIERLRQGDIRCIISTTIFDEGIDVKPLDTLILAGQGKSKVRAMQRIGRVIRPFKNKPNPSVIDFMLHQKYLDKHAEERLTMYATESEYNIDHIDSTKFQ